MHSITVVAETAQLCRVMRHDPDLTMNACAAHALGMSGSAWNGRHMVTYSSC